MVAEADLVNVLPATGLAPLALVFTAVLLINGLYSRLTSCLLRIRILNGQAFVTTRDLGSHGLERAQFIREWHEQTTDVYNRARWIEAGLYFFLMATALLAVASVLQGWTPVSASLAYPAIAMFLLGITSFLLGILCAIVELRKCLGPIHEEIVYVENVVAEQALLDTLPTTASSTLAPAGPGYCT
eukprot:Opistho-2@85566